MAFLLNNLRRFGYAIRAIGARRGDKGGLPRVDAVRSWPRATRKRQKPEAMT